MTTGEGPDVVEEPADAVPERLTLYSPAGVVTRPAGLTLAARRLRRLGFDVRIDESARARHQRFAGDDATRLAALHRVADEAPSIALATRGGYGLTRLLDAIDWRRIARSVERGTRWVGHSDLTALQLGLLAQVGVGAGSITWAGPLAVDHFGRTDADGGVDEITQDCFLEAMDGQLEAVGFRTEAGFDGLQAHGVLWGGNLTMVCSLLGTPHLPSIDGGILFLEDVNEHPYRVERNLLQLHRAGVLARQHAIVLGEFNGWRAAPQDRGYGLKSVVNHLRSVVDVPILTGLPFGHVPMVVTLPVGAEVELVVDRRSALIGWGHGAGGDEANPGHLHAHVSIEPRPDHHAAKQRSGDIGG